MRANEQRYSCLRRAPAVSSGAVASSRTEGTNNWQLSSTEHTRPTRSLARVACRKTFYRAMNVALPIVRSYKIMLDEASD
eukprot:3574705-Pleurochrysis_carterae.AAC.2